MPRRDQGQRQGRRIRRRRTDLHGPQQPEPAQRAVPRLPEAVGGLYRRQDQLDRPRPGRLQPPPAAGDRDRNGRFRHPRNGRALRRRRLRQGPRLGDAGLGQEADRDGRLSSATCKPPVGTWDGKTYRITVDGDCHNFNYRTDVFSDAGLAEAGRPKRRQGRLSGMGRAEDLAAGPGRHQIPQGQAGQRPGRLRLSRRAEGRGAASASISSAAAPAPMPSIPTTRPGCSIRTR